MQDQFESSEREGFGDEPLPGEGRSEGGLGADEPGELGDELGGGELGDEPGGLGEDPGGLGDEPGLEDELGEGALGEDEESSGGGGAY